MDGEQPNTTDLEFLDKISPFLNLYHSKCKLKLCPPEIGTHWLSIQMGKFMQPGTINKEPVELDTSITSKPTPKLNPKLLEKAYLVGIVFLWSSPMKMTSILAVMDNFMGTRKKIISMCLPN